MLHILLVEDNAGDVLLVREAIRASSVEADVIIAYDGQQALRFLTHFNLEFAFIILDLNLPKFNGFDLLKRYNARQGPPVVVLTGSNSRGDEQHARELGAKDYVVKPLAFQEFIDTVKALVERWGERAMALGRQLEPHPS